MGTILYQTIPDDNGFSSLNKIDQLGIQLSSLIDLEEIDVQVYLNLLRMGQVTASTIAKELRIDRTKTYRIIDKLMQMQMVSTTFSKPKLCVANNPDEVLSNILEKKENQVSRIKKAKENLIKSIKSSIPNHYTSNFPTFRITQGSSNIYSEIEKLVENARNDVFIVTTLRDLSKMYHSNIPEKIRRFEKRGGKVHLFTEITNQGLKPFVERFGATETKVGNVPGSGRIVVEKEGQMLMSGTTLGYSEQNESEFDFAMTTNSSEMVKNIFSLCLLLWKNGKFIR